MELRLVHAVAGADRMWTAEDNPSMYEFLFDETLAREWRRALRARAPLGLLMIDADRFKSINDAYGHGVGDFVLKKLAAICTAELRTCDYIGRIGGEEFAIVMPETAYEQGLDVARKLRAAVSHTPFKAGKKSIRVTASFGVCGIDQVPGGEPKLAERMLKIADLALYGSKKGGRNRVTATRLQDPTAAAET